MTKFIFYFILLGGSLRFIRQRKHILISLMSLEFLVLSFFLGIGILIIKDEYNRYILLFYLTYAACEGALGLSIIVSIVRGYGRDLFSLSGFIQC